MPGDNIPRRSRLVSALYFLANYYNKNKSYEKADQFYAETFAMLSEDKSASGLDSYRYYAESAARDYMDRGDLAKAKPYIDDAVKICRDDPEQRKSLTLPWTLRTLARWQREMKQPKEAEATLLEAIGILGEHASGERIQLADIYIETAQHDMAEKTIGELEKSTYAKSAVMFLRAKWLRATGKVVEADELDAKARAKEIVELEHQRNSQ